MAIAGLANSGAAPALENMIRFAAQRQKLLMHNIANLSTPDFQQADVSIAGFQANLRRAIEARRTTGGQGPLELERTGEVVPRADGSFRLTPRSASGGVLFHDRNNRSLEKLMQGLTENASAFQVATNLLRSHNDLIRSAISQRV